jgi:hypothetical protein
MVRLGSKEATAVRRASVSAFHEESEATNHKNEYPTKKKFRNK